MSMDAALPPFPGLPDEAARIVALLEEVAVDHLILNRENDGTFVPGGHAVSWFRESTITDPAGTVHATLTEAQCQWAFTWLQVRAQPQIEARERAELARLLAKYPPS